MVKWKCHKVVEAGKIIGVVPNPSQPGVILHLSGSKEAIGMTPEGVKKHNPEVGGYFIRYADGYTSYSPAKAFEEGYTQITVVSDEQLVQLTGEPILQFFSFAHLPDYLQRASRPFAELAYHIMQQDRTPERTVALRKLLESKDAAVRNALSTPKITAVQP